MSDERYVKKQSLLSRFVDFLLVGVFRRVNKVIPWHRLWSLFGVPNLLALRVELRRHNLHDTDGDLTQPKTNGTKVCPFHTGPNATRQRTEDGTLNDLWYPAMGCRFSRLGRNMRSLRPISEEPALMHPNPLLISEKLMKRDKFIPAESLNLLAGAWIQFQVHDWFGHENEHQDAGKDIRVPQAGDWPPEDTELRKHVPPTGEMVIPKTMPDPTNSDPLNARYPAFRNKDPQWWDASQVYGESVEETLRLRTDTTKDPAALCPHGKLHLDGRGFLPRNKDGHVLSGFTDNWWLGLEILHTLFAKEHNAICDRLNAAEPHLTDQEIFETARLVNCAIMAKIHSVEWTPGILNHPAIQPALDANWMGFIGHFINEGTARTVASWLPHGVIQDVLTGIPLSETDHHGAPYSLTEEFNAVYRLHPLLPDEVPIRSYETGEQRKSYPMTDIAFAESRRPLDDGASMADVIYSFGVAHPGAITIKNYPNFLRELKLPIDADNGRTREQVLDLAAVDIIRDRERGVPRYNEFRRQLRMKPVETWEELAGCRPDLAGVLKEIYEGKLEDVDTMVGMFCEPLPKGFGFSDTAFRIFILMASRRLKSDRFFTSDYRAEIYTEAGLDWIRRTGMKEIILRHHPDLKFAFENVRNPFAPWQTRA